MERLTTIAFTDTMSDTTPTTQTTLVLGGTGKTGRRVAQRLDRPRRADPHRLALGFTPVRLGRRDHLGARPAGRHGGLRRVLPRPGVPRRRRDHPRLRRRPPWRVASRRLVLLSGRGEEEAAVSERAVQESGADWTILRASWFAQNFSEHFLLEPVLGGVIALPAGRCGGTVRRRRRHRRRRGRSADRGSATPASCTS